MDCDLPDTSATGQQFEAFYLHISTDDAVQEALLVQTEGELHEVQKPQSAAIRPSLCCSSGPTGAGVGMCVWK